MWMTHVKAAAGRGQQDSNGCYAQPPLNPCCCSPSPSASPSACRPARRLPTLPGGCQELLADGLDLSQLAHLNHACSSSR